MTSNKSDSNKIDTYRWDAPSLITQMDVRTHDNTGLVAYIYAPASEAPHSERLHELREVFRKKGWGTSSDIHNGKPVLRLSGVTNINDLTAILYEDKYAEGKPHITSSAPENPHLNPLQSLKSNSLRSSGIFYTIGNALMIFSGLKHGKSIEQMGTGISFAMGDVLLTAFGGRDDNRQFRSLLTKLKDHLDKEGIEIPDQAALNVETMARPEGFLEKIYDFMHEHINVFKICAEIAGGALYFLAGLSHNKPEFRNPQKMAAGAVIVTGWLAALLIHEKKRDVLKWEHAGPLEKAKMYIQEKPTRLAGWSGLVHNGLTTWGAFGERKKGIDAYKWDLAMVSAMVTANSLYSISSKTTGGNIETDALVNDVYGLAAQVLNKQPAEVRDKAIETTARFLGERPEIKDTYPQIIKRLEMEMNVISHNPWFEPIPNYKPVAGIAR